MLSRTVLDVGFLNEYRSVCKRGYSVLDRHVESATLRGNSWMFDAMYPPGYAAHGRMRFLKTLQMARAIRPQSVLEVAAGGGLLGSCLHEKGRRVVVNDLREMDLDCWRNGKELNVVAGDLFSLSAAELGTFDLVVACEVIEHVAHGEEFLAHLSSFIKPGGWLLLTTPNGAYVRSKLPTYSQIKNFSELEARQFQPDADGHLYLYTRSEMQKLLETTAYTQISIDLAVTPFIAGGMGFRALPARERLVGAYYVLDALARSASTWISERICTQMYVLARKPS